jgi:ABC-2 type transport system permease protein
VKHEYFTALLRHELRLLTRSRAAWVVSAALAAAVVCAGWNGHRWTNHQRATLVRVQGVDAENYRRIYAELEDLERRNDPHPDLQLAGMAWYIFQPDGAVAPAPHIDPRRAEAAASEWVGARHVVLPPGPLAALATGQSDLYPYYARVTIRTPPILVHSDELENPANLLNGRFDLAFVVMFCWPLLVLPLVYNVVSEERETGTLVLVGSQPVSLRIVLAVRLAVRSGMAVIVTVFASLASLAMVGELSGAPASEIAAWSFAVVSVGIFWSAVAAVVNLFRWQSATNATALMACWLGLVVVAPGVIEETASAIAPVPSRVELVNAVRTAGNLSSSQLAALTSTYYEEHPDAARSTDSADVTAIRGLAQQDALDRRIEPIVEQYHASVAHREAIVNRLRFLSPPLLVYDAVLELAGTSTTRVRRFAEQVDEYHREWQAYFYPLVHARASMTRALYDGAPRFTFREEPIRQTTWRALDLIATTFLTGGLLMSVALARLTSV